MRGAFSTPARVMREGGAAPLSQPVMQFDIFGIVYVSITIARPLHLQGVRALRSSALGGEHAEQQPQLVGQAVR